MVAKAAELDFNAASYVIRSVGVSNGSAITDSGVLAVRSTATY